MNLSETEIHISQGPFYDFTRYHRIFKTVARLIACRKTQNLASWQFCTFRYQEDLAIKIQAIWWAKSAVMAFSRCLGCRQMRNVTCDCHSTGYNGNRNRFWNHERHLPECQITAIRTMTHNTLLKDRSKPSIRYESLKTYLRRCHLESSFCQREPSPSTY